MHAEAFKPQEHDLLNPMVEGTRKNFQQIGVQGDIFEQAKLTAAGKSGSKTECLAYIKEVWTDMRPLSLRKKMEKQEDIARRYVG